MKRTIVLAAAHAMVLCLGSMYTTPALAQDSVVKAMEAREADAKKKAEEAAKAKKPLPQGWKPFLNVGATVQLGQSSNVVGRPDGQTYSLGAAVGARLDYRKGQHEWNNRFNFQVQQTNTPAVSGWVKSLDTGKLESSYVWSPSDRFGVFASFTLDTAFFGAEDVRSGPTDYLIKEPNGRFSGDRGGVAGANGAIRQVLLTKEFAPSLLAQGVGASVKVYEGHKQKVMARVGLGAQETFARGGIAITDDAATASVVEATRLQDFQQLGGQLKILADGQAADNVTYAFVADFLFPFYNSLDTGKGFADTINASIDLKVGFKVSKWMSIEYVLGVRRQPLLVDKWQVWNGLLASFTANIVE